MRVGVMGEVMRGGWVVGMWGGGHGRRWVYAGICREVGRQREAWEIRAEAVDGGREIRS